MFYTEEQAKGKIEELRPTMSDNEIIDYICGEDFSRQDCFDDDDILWEMYDIMGVFNLTGRA